MQFDYHDPAVLPLTNDPGPLESLVPDLLRDLGQRAGTWFDILRLPRLRRRALGQARSGGVSEVAPFLDLAPYPDLDAYLASRKRTVRRELRRRTARLEEMGELRFRMHPPSELRTVVELIPTFIAEKRKRYQQFIYIDGPERYFSELATQSIGSIACCSSLSLGDRAIGWEIGFLLHGTYYSYITAYDTELRALSPGNVHLCHLIGWVIGQGGRTFDLMCGNEDYKSIWTDGAVAELHKLEVVSDAAATRFRIGTHQGLRTAKRLLVAPRLPTQARPLG
jgi:CelD/BcsL family acetyltransferase involved in cellulose biosynthesis